LKEKFLNCWFGLNFKITPDFRDSNKDYCHPEFIEGCHPELVEGCHPEFIEGCHPELGDCVAIG
jgi:hypothetical protein